MLPSNLPSSDLLRAKKHREGEKSFQSTITHRMVVRKQHWNSVTRRANHSGGGITVVPVVVLSEPCLPARLIKRAERMKMAFLLLPGRQERLPLAHWWRLKGFSHSEALQPKVRIPQGEPEL